MTKDKLKTLLVLHIMLMVYSTSGIFSKLAAGQPFLSFKWCLFYGGVIALLGMYAIGWQQIIKRLPLTTAFANKAVAVVWGLIWGLVFFHEEITLAKIVGVLLVVAGVVLYSKSDKEDTDND